LFQELLDYKAKYLEMQKTENGLRKQISMYGEKYDEFQQTLSRSNEIFAGFKSEMESVSQNYFSVE
jgi:Myosin-like coiled-coil protein.